MQRTFRFGVVGLGMMGKEFASASARWIHLQGNIPVPEIVGVCSATEKSLEWFAKNVPTVRWATTDYRALLQNPEIDCVYVASPHNTHAAICVDTLKAGKHLICEKPFGIDRAANLSICEESRRHPELLARCASQMIFFPGARMVLDWFRAGRFGRILQIKVGFKHSSDLNPLKPINWKRQVATNGEYGVMGDLAPHALLLPLRAGLEVRSVYAMLSNIVTERYNADGALVPCDTWDNAMILCNASIRGTDDCFPMEVEVARIAPGEPNTWFIEVYGMEASIRYSSADTNNVYAAEKRGVEQIWSKYEVGYSPVYPSITSGQAAFGFGDALMQMWAAYMDELGGSTPLEGCMTPEESLFCHRILDGALRSQKTGGVIDLLR